MIFVGLDLGLSGAAAMIDPRGQQAVWDLATVESAAGRRIDGRQLLDVLRAWVPPGEPCVVVIEDVRPQTGAHGSHGNTMQSQGSLMRSRGIAEAVCDIMPAVVTWVWPQTWKRYYGLLGKQKPESRALAGRLLPSTAAWLTRVKDHNRAEALLLAYWGMRSVE